MGSQMIKGLEHEGTEHKCTVCSCDYTDDEGGIQGYFGILPVSFCPTCSSSMMDMAQQMLTWQGIRMYNEDMELINGEELEGQI
jgi:uncharacterized protein (DUF983 family)